MQTITLRLKLHQPTKAKQAVYRELAVRVTGLANNLVAAGRPTKLTSKTAKPHCPDRIPSAVINQALRDVAAHPKVERFRALWPGFNNQNCRLERVGDFWTASFPTHVGRVRVPLQATDRQAQLLAKLGATVKQGTAKLYEKRERWYLALSISVRRKYNALRRRMGKAKALGAIRRMKDKEARFKCTACGHIEHADSVGAPNIARAISGLAAA